MSCDDISGEMNFEAKVSDLAKLIQANNAKADQPSVTIDSLQDKTGEAYMETKPNPITYTPDPWAWLKNLKPNTSKPQDLIDLYSERKQRERGETPEVDLQAIDALGKSELIDLYQERRLRKRK